MAMKKNAVKKETIKPEIYETEIEFFCPVRGKIKQKVKIKKYPSVESQIVGEILPSKSITEKLDLQHSGLILDDSSLSDEESDIE
jgi:hypothetical protein